MPSLWSVIKANLEIPEDTKHSGKTNSKLEGIRGSVTKAKIDLHWLPIKERIEFKIVSLVFKSFSVCGPRLWNNLPEYLRGRSDHQKFKMALVTHLFKRVIMYDKLPCYAHTHMYSSGCFTL